MTRHTDTERPWWRDRADEIELQVGMGKMKAMACYTQMLQLLDAERRAPAAPVPQGWKSVPVELLERIQESLGSFVSDHGWSQSDMDTADALDGLLAAAPQPPEAAPVELPEPVAYRMHDPEEPEIGHWLHEGRGMACLVHEPLYTEQQVRELLAAHGIGKDKA